MSYLCDPCHDWLMRIDRMLAMTVMLLNRERVSAREMAERFEVSVRTIYRDLDAMDAAGIPIVSFQGGGGGYALPEGYTLDRQLLTFDGMVQILTALKGAHAAFEDEEIVAIMDKLNALVPRGRRHEAEEKLQRFEIDLTPWGMPERVRESLKEIRRAVTEDRVLTFAYATINRESTRRAVEPLTLIFKGYSWYLYAWCRLRGDFRLFRLSRMREVAVQRERFERRDAPAANLKIPGFGGAAVDFVLRFSSAVRSTVEDQFGDTELSEEADGSILARFAFPEDEWVYGMILSFGDAVEVIEPVHVRTIVANRAKKIGDLYKPDRGVSRAPGTIRGIKPPGGVQ